MEPLPAVQRYDGPAFRVLRRYLRESTTSLPVRIISSEFGLIGPDEQIGLYDRRMTSQRAQELEPLITAAFEPFISTTNFDDLMVFASGAYTKAMVNCWSMLPKQVRVHTPSGSIGGQTAQLHDWLHGKPPASAPATVTGQTTFRGVKIAGSASDIIDLARRELQQDMLKAEKYESWCVPVDQTFVAPKWLVSKLSGIPVSRFRTADAMNVLKKLGVEVRRVGSPSTKGGLGC